MLILKVILKAVLFYLQIIQQMGTYMNWINSQLDKRDDQTRKVADLSKDMRDGVIFLQLVEVIGKYIHTNIVKRTIIKYNRILIDRSR